jgi:hypothetical protein
MDTGTARGRLTTEATQMAGRTGTTTASGKGELRATTGAMGMATAMDATISELLTDILQRPVVADTRKKRT